MSLSLRTVVIGGVTAGLLLPMSAATYYQASRERAALLADSEAAHGRMSEVLALSVQKALWDLAPEGAEPIVKSIMNDPRVVSATILDAEDKVFHEEKVEARRAGMILTLDKPVLNDGQTIGKVRVEFSFASAEAAIAANIRQTLVAAGVQALVCILVLVLLLNQRVLRRVALLKKQAGMLAQKRLDHEFRWVDGDEIGVLGASLESTRQALKALFGELERKNADLAAMNQNLELKVEERTATIKMILDHVKSGFLLVGRDLRIENGYTRSCAALLGSADLGGQALTSALGLGDKASGHFICCLDQVFEDIFPEEVSLDQIPRRHRIGDRVLSLEGATVRGADGRVDRILFTVIDITLLEQTERENRSNRALVRILQNMGSFRDFVRDARTRLQAAQVALTRRDEVTVRRELHTLKGNSAAFGLEEISELVHTVEDEVRIAGEQLRRVEDGFTRFLDDRYDMLKVRFDVEDQEACLVDEGQLRELRQEVMTAGTPAAALNAVERWIGAARQVPVEALVGPMGSYVDALARQRGKQVRFSLTGGQLRIDPGLKPVMQSLVHLVRNAIDHGIEAPGDRDGKEPEAVLSLDFRQDGEGLEIRVRDDGRGIDFEALARKATAAGLPPAGRDGTRSREDLIGLLYMDGLSTAGAVTDTSGRGVGMGAFRQEVVTRGGRIEVRTESGRGTEFIIRLPPAPVPAELERTRAA